MKSLCIVFALLSQFQVEELEPNHSCDIGLIFQLEELAQPKQVDNRPTLDFLSAKWCGHCKKPHEVLDKLTKEQRDKLPFKIRNRDVDVDGYQSATLIPAFIVEGKVIQTGWDGIEGLVKRFEKSRSNKRQAVQRLSSAQLKAFAYSYQGAPYGVDNGDYWGHLQNGTTHRFTVNQLNGLTQAECAKIHAGDHYGYLTPYSIGGK